MKNLKYQLIYVNSKLISSESKLNKNIFSRFYDLIYISASFS